MTPLHKPLVNLTTFIKQILPIPFIMESHRPALLLYPVISFFYHCMVEETFKNNFTDIIKDHSIPKSLYK